MIRPIRTRPRRRQPSVPMWSRKCGQVPALCCPEGANDSSPAIYCLERIEWGIRPVGHGLIPSPGSIIRANGGTPIRPNHTVPYGTVLVFASIPGNKLPGYFHNVPTGQGHLTPVHEFGVTSPPIFEA